MYIYIYIYVCKYKLYLELAKEERNRHMQLYPGWSARDNYGLKKKRQSSGPTILNNSHKKAPRENNSMVNSPGHLNHNSPIRFGQQHHLVNSPHTNSKNVMQLENGKIFQKVYFSIIHCLFSMCIYILRLSKSEEMSSSFRLRRSKSMV